MTVSLAFVVFFLVNMDYRIVDVLPVSTVCNGARRLRTGRPSSAEDFHPTRKMTYARQNGAIQSDGMTNDDKGTLNKALAFFLPALVSSTQALLNITFKSSKDS